MADSDQDWSIRCVACGQWYLPPGLDDSGFPQGDHGCSKPGGDASRDGLTIKEVLREMRSAALWVGGSIAAILFAMAATTTPVGNSSPVMAAPIGPRQQVPSLTASHLRRLWIKELFGMSSSGSAKTSSSVSGSSGLGNCNRDIPELHMSGSYGNHTIPQISGSAWQLDTTGTPYPCYVNVRVDCQPNAFGQYELRVSLLGPLGCIILLNSPCGAGVTYEILSQDPILITVDWPAGYPSGGCAAGSITISE